MGVCDWFFTVECLICWWIMERMREAKKQLMNFLFISWIVWDFTAGRCVSFLITTNWLVMRLIFERFAIWLLFSEQTRLVRFVSVDATRSNQWLSGNLSKYIKVRSKFFDAIEKNHSTGTSFRFRMNKMMPCPNAIPILPDGRLLVEDIQVEVALWCMITMSIQDCSISNPIAIQSSLVWSIKENSSRLVLWRSVLVNSTSINHKERLIWMNPGVFLEILASLVNFANIQKISLKWLDFHTYHWSVDGRFERKSISDQTEWVCDETCRKYFATSDYYVTREIYNSETCLIFEVCWTFSLVFWWFLWNHFFLLCTTSKHQLFSVY